MQNERTNNLEIENPAIESAVATNISNGSLDCDEHEFVYVFAPIAHHVFPDGCPDEFLLDAWPIRTSRATVPYSGKAIKDLYRTARTNGFLRNELESLIYLACHIVSGQCTSPIISQFPALIRCVIPKAGKGNLYLSDKILEKLLFVRLERDDLALLYQFLTLCLRNHVLISPSQLIPYYPLLFQKCRELDEAVHLVHLITQRNQVRIYRARRVRQWYNEGERISLFYLLELYASLDPTGCLQYAPKDINLASNKKKPISKINWHWEQELKGICQKQGSTSSKRERGKDTFVPLHVKMARSDDFLQTSLASTDTITPFRAHLPYVLYEEWYPSPYRHHEEVGELDLYSDDDDMEEEEKPSRLVVSVTESRVQVIDRIADATIYLGKMLPETEVFILNSVLPTWDGSGTWGLRLCHDVLPLVRPQMYGKIIPVIEPLLRCCALPQLDYLLLGVVLPQWIRCSHRSLEKKDIFRLIQWTTSLLQSCFLGTAGHELHRLALVLVYDAVRDITSLLPNSRIVYSLLLSPTPIAINRLCALLLSYKTILEKEKDRQQSNELTQERIRLYNSYIWDVCTVLWNGKTSYNTNVSLLYQMMPLLVQKCGDSLSLARSAAFLDYFPSGGITNRAHYVDYLKNRGMHGLHTFLLTFVGALADREERRKQRLKRKRDTSIGKNTINTTC
mmetsp:Transcript_5428/g.8321  ORF Transcript_5428/g.8321 Transcript_5428/m.8321 type:complete len:678 (+) Transcript_5428:62-2095(+)